MSKKESVISSDSSHDVAIVIPTVGGPPLLGCVSRLIQHQCGKRVHLVISLNPLNDMQAEQTKHLCVTMLEGSGLSVTWVESPRAIGFGNAVNKGIDALTSGDGLPPVVVLLNDDTAPGPHWLEGICEAFDAQTFTITVDPDEQSYPISQYGRVGVVGPTSSYVWKDQRIEVELETDEQIDQFCIDFRDSNEGNFVATDVISGFCVALHRDLVLELIESDGWVFDPIYSENVGGFEDDDLCVRAAHAGWRCLVAGQTYVHHFGSQTIGSMDIGNGLKNWPTHLRKWKEYTQRDQTLAAAYRVKLDTINDMLMFKGSLQNAASLSDSISVLFTGNPKVLTEAYDVGALGQHLSDADREFVSGCDIPEVEEIARLCKVWVEGVVSESWHGGSGQVAVEMWEGFFNERDERNAALAMTHQFGPDWIISFDHDEVFEARVTREKMEHLMHHPNPAVMAWDFAWMNHWNSPQHIRIDAPWGDGGDYTGSMRGYRMYRHIPSLSAQISAGKPNGLHCGNIPAFSSHSCRAANMRFHHFGYMRSSDRMRKAKSYMELDPDGEMMSRMPGILPYQHLVDETNMVITPTPTCTGIAFSALLYEKEKPADLARVLDTIHGMCDSVSLVWTDPRIEEPTTDFADVADLYGVQWCRKKFEMDLSACRNEGLALSRTLSDEGVGWLFTLDMDEFFQNDILAMTTIRRMAENQRDIAWMFNFINTLATADKEERANSSSTVRMFRIREDFDLHWKNRVHESISQSMFALRDQGHAAQFRNAPFKMLHVGLNQKPDEIHGKLEKYAKMLVMDIEEDPDQTMPWISLALHFLNDRQVDNAVHCFNCALAAKDGDVWLARKELALHHLRIAKTLFEECRETVPLSHPYFDVVTQMTKMLGAIHTDFPHIGRAAEGKYVASEVNEVPNVLPMKLMAYGDALSESESGVG